MHLLWRRLGSALALLALLPGCSMSADDAQSGEFASTEAPPEAPPPHRPVAAPPEPIFDPSADPQIARLTESGLRVTSTVLAEDGSLFVTGTFSNSVQLGNITLQSRGDVDVFLLKSNPDQSMAWAQSIGSEDRESKPTVTIQTHQVRIVGQTEGHLDCGNGALPQWSNNDFFFCVFDRDGVNIEGGTFPIVGSP
jgi:hypothetical protein